MTGTGGDGDRAVGGDGVEASGASDSPFGGDGGEDSGGDAPARRTQSFYTRWADLYDALATRAPGVDRLRRRAVEALGLSPGAFALDLGCGTGANLPFLRDAVGPTGTVVGVDFTPGMVARARERADRWENVHVVRGDATRLPVGPGAEGSGAQSQDADADSPVATASDGCDAARPVPDAVLASFLSGMLDDPAAAVDDWCSIVAPGGRVALLDLARSTGLGRPLNPLFAVAVHASTPPGGEASAASLTATLDERVAAAHRTLLASATATTHETAMLSFVRLSAGMPD